MKSFLKLILGLVIIGTIASCGKTGCPEGMHEVNVNGQKICVPNDL